MKAKGIINRDPKRVFKLEEKMINLIINNGYCLGCGDYLMLKDSHGGHDKAWDDGGLTINCNTTCRGCNWNQGKMLFDEWFKSDRRKQYLLDKNNG